MPAKLSCLTVQVLKSLNPPPLRHVDLVPGFVKTSSGLLKRRAAARSATVHRRNERYVQLEWLEGHRAGMQRAIEGTVEGQNSRHE